MKATGIIVRIDDLGRITIPKELRKKMEVRFNDCIEFYTHEDGTITIKKFNPEDELVDWFIELDKKEKERFLEKIKNFY